MRDSRPVPPLLDAALRATLDSARPEERAELDTHLGRVLGGPGCRVQPDGQWLDVLFPASADTWRRFARVPFDPEAWLEEGPALLPQLDQAASDALGSEVDVIDLRATRFAVVVEGEPGAGEMSLVDAHDLDPESVVGDELGVLDVAATLRIRAHVLSLLRERLPLVVEASPARVVEALPDDPSPRPLELSPHERELFDRLRVDPEARRRELERLAAHRDVHEVWHVLAAHAEAVPADRELVESLLVPWADGARRMPRVWMDAIRHRQFAPHHRLVRELVVEEAEVSLLEVPGIEESLGGLRGLGLQELRADTLTRVAELAWLGSLTRVSLIDCEVHGREFARSAAFPSVTELEVRGRRATAEGLADLIVGSAFPRLERLRLFQVGRGLLDLAGGLGDRPLERSFRLSMTGLPTIGLGRFLRTPAVQGLKGLSFIGMELSAAQVRALAGAELSLERLLLHTGKLGPEGAATLAQASWLPGLQELAVSAMSTGDRAMAELLRTMRSCVDLELRHNQLSGETLDVLAHADLSQLARLDLSHNPLDDAGLARLLRNPSLTRLRRLSLLGTGAGAQTFESIASASFPQLRVLEVGDDVPDAAAELLVHASLPALERLQLRGASAEVMQRIVDAADFAPHVLATNAMFA